MSRGKCGQVGWYVKSALGERHYPYCLVADQVTAQLTLAIGRSDQIPTECVTLSREHAVVEPARIRGFSARCAGCRRSKDKEERRE